jgi:hypothetical protein
VIDVLPAPGRVRADSLDMAHGVRADPDVLPGGREDELADALEDLSVFDPLAVLEVLETPAASAALDPRS